MGMIPVAYAPSSVVLDAAENTLLVANDKGIGARNSNGTTHGVTSLNTHQDNGDSSLAVFGDNATFGSVKPNAHALVQRLPLFDNFYDPSPQSADGHNWIVQAMAPYSDDIQSPDWVRDYHSNGGDAIAYQKRGNLFNLAAKAGIKLKNYGEYVEYNTFKTPTGSTAEPSWIDFYNDTLSYESGKEKQLYYYNTVSSHSPLPDVINHTVNNYPQFDLGIPDQSRVDIWKQDFAKDVAAGTVPAFNNIAPAKADNDD